MPVYRFQIVTNTLDGQNRREQDVTVDLPFEFGLDFSLDECKQLETRIAQDHKPENHILEGIFLLDQSGNRTLDVVAEHERRFGFETDVM